MIKVIKGVFSLLRTSLRISKSWEYHAASWRHSAMAAARFCLNVSRGVRWRSRLKWLWIEAWIEANFCRVFTSRNFNIAPSRRLNGCCEFSALLLSHRPHPWSAALPITFIAARYDRSRSGTITLGCPYRFIVRLRNWNAALRFRRFEA